MISSKCSTIMNQRLHFYADITNKHNYCNNNPPTFSIVLFQTLTYFILYLVPSSDIKNGKTCFGCRCILRKINQKNCILICYIQMHARQQVCTQKKSVYNNTDVHLRTTLLNGMKNYPKVQMQFQFENFVQWHFSHGLPVVLTVWRCEILVSSCENVRKVPNKWDT